MSRVNYPFMPCLFAPGQHKALQRARRHLHPSDASYALPRDILCHTAPRTNRGPIPNPPDSLPQHAKTKHTSENPTLGTAKGRSRLGCWPCCRPKIQLRMQAGQETGRSRSPVDGREFVGTKLQQRRLEDQDRLLLAGSPLARRVVFGTFLQGAPLHGGLRRTGRRCSPQLLGDVAGRWLGRGAAPKKNVCVLCSPWAWGVRLGSAVPQRHAVNWAS